MNRLPSYKSDGKNHCNHDSEQEPCYGEVELTDEQCTDDYSDCWDIYQCEGHVNCHTFYCWTGYKRSPYPEDQECLNLKNQDFSLSEEISRFN